MHNIFPQWNTQISSVAQQKKKKANKTWFYFNDLEFLKQANNWRHIGKVYKNTLF